MKLKVWVVAFSQYDKPNVLGVYSSLKEAEENADDYCGIFETTVDGLSLEAEDEIELEASDTSDASDASPSEESSVG